MTDQEKDNSEVETFASDSASEDSINEARSSRKRSVWMYTSPLYLLVLLIIAVVGYLALSGIDMAWAFGTSNWVIPPGTTLAGKNIGGKTFDEITQTIADLSNGFATQSVWLAESSIMSSVFMDDFVMSTAYDELVITALPNEIGLSIDTNSIKQELATLEETSGTVWAFGDRIRMWQDPPSINALIAVDDDVARDYLQGVKSTVDCEPVNASMDLANQHISPSKDGVVLDIEASLANMPKSLGESGRLVIELSILRTEPAVTADAFSGIDVENPLATYTTKFATYKRNRSQNIYMVAQHFEEVVIQPGEILSFNDTTGPRTYHEGYLAAPMYMNNRVEMSPAGGACQVSTTLYNAALLAGLEIVERYPHSRPCSYVPYGRDATVAYDTGVDLRFKNTLDHAIILHQEVDYLRGGTITFEIFGNPSDRVHVEIGNAYSWLGRAEPRYIVDTSLAPGQEVVEDEGTNGISQRAWRTWFDEEGNEIRTEQLSSDRIRSIPALIRHNPAEGEETEESGETTEELMPSETPDPEEPPPGQF